MSASFLTGIRVIESASLLNGDTLGMLLGDLGADVVKVEAPGRGDYLRDFLGQITEHNSPAHLQVNRNKRSLNLDLRTEQGRAIFWRLLDTADVFVDGNAPGTLDRLGVGVSAQRDHKPGIVYCQYTGFGANGPYAAIPAHGVMMNALVGATPMVLGDDGQLHSRAISGLGGTERAGDGTTAGALNAALYVTAALLRRDRTGEGCFLDVAASDAVVMSALNTAVLALNEHRLTDRSTLPPVDGGEWQGSRYQFYETGDHKVVLLAAIEPKFWLRFCVAIDRTDLAERGADTGTAPVDFGADPAERLELQRIFQTKTSADWLKLAVEHRLPIGPAPTDLLMAISDPHVLGRDIVVEGHHSSAGDFTYIGRAAVVPEVPFSIRHEAPSPGQHTRELLLELGLADAEITELETQGVV